MWLPAVIAACIAAVAAVVGHCFPVWLGFRGGKGVSTALGVAFALANAAFWGLYILFSARVGGLFQGIGSQMSSDGTQAGYNHAIAVTPGNDNQVTGADIHQTAEIIQKALGTGNVDQIANILQNATGAVPSP